MKLGNSSGRFKSSIIASQSPGFFGITEQQLADDVDTLIIEEAIEGNAVQPVHVNELGQLYIIVNALNSGIQPLLIDPKVFIGEIQVIFPGQTSPQNVLASQFKPIT